MHMIVEYLLPSTIVNFDGSDDSLPAATHSALTSQCVQFFYLPLMLMKIMHNNYCMGALANIALKCEC